MRSLRFVITGLVTLAALPGFADIPRTPEGRPDMQGVWANNAATPLERPEALADKAELTAEEVARFKAKHDELFGGDGEAAFGDSVFKSIVADDQEHESYDPATGNYNHFWVVDRNIENRTSLIVDPPTGRMPALTEAAAAWAEEQAEYRVDAVTSLPKEEMMKIIAGLEEQMKVAAQNLEFEKAAALRDQVFELKGILAEEEDLKPWERIKLMAGES